MRTRECIWCKRVMPLEAFQVKVNYHNVRSRICRDCSRLGHSCTRVEKPKRGRRPNFKSEEERREQRRAYIKRWKQEHAEKVSAYNKKYLKERREAKKAVKAEPRKVEVKEEKLLRVADIPTPRPQVVSRPGCEGCTKYPCFKGMENTETDFAKEGCHHYTTI